QVREQVADIFAALAILLEVPFRPNDASPVTMTAASEGAHVNGLSVEAIHIGFVVERIDLARPAIHEEKDDAFGLGGKVPLPDGQRIGGARRWLIGEEAILRKQPRECKTGEAGASFPEELAPGTATEILLGRHQVSSESPAECEIIRRRFFNQDT